jgi:23S rRNA (cytosine1962-C5)-methyltransferase
LNFLRLHDALPTALFEDDDILAIDKPYGFNAHTNDSKIEHSEFIQDGLIEIYEKNLGRKLHVIHRLDQTTTGVMIFGKSVESAKKYADFFFHRQVKKTYWFLTKSKSTQAEFLVEDKIIHKGKELEAKTQLHLLNRANDFELWQAKPMTGRNHQIRIHAKSAGLAILGDTKYEGRAYPFLCLHNHQIEFPNGIKIVSKPPAYFESTEILTDTVLTRALFEADRRLRLFSFAGDADQCYRLVHGKNNSEDPGFTVDQFGRVLVLNWYKEYWDEDEVKKFSFFATFMKRPIVVRLLSETARTGSQKTQIVIYPLVPTESLTTIWTAKENQIQYEMRSDAGASAGVLLNQRLQRDWVQAHAKGKDVLSLFSNTCGFGVAATIGQALQVTSVDASKNALDWGRRNFALNKLDADKAKFLCRDSFAYIDQCVNKKVTYDLIVADTPSFLRREKRPFKIKTDLEGWIEKCLLCLNPKGEFLFSTSFDGFFIGDIQKIILQAQKNLEIPHLEINSILPSLDFELPDEKPVLKSFLLRLN